ncbi:NAD(P)/FAD-dependent oxidoreductase [Candidatus Mycobacterium methanotrophicum]|uniref:FAD-binding oxidoreductase n=1 Tax=Candidatus Mycobacterium methanotrophicum TaxID=2943498 RepID=A0ABY4QTA5_9MYCO|nr:FAD-binding oxidoreductase [Candidatus Mycobacterium methanotrophicum]UQX13628.1 FAD-binding oxidoreductase [Candidatus Mycobacterium methanotrophicum]
MSIETAEVVIVGGGIEGAAVAWSLSQRGIGDVVVVERNTVGSGMTGKSSGIVRCHYGVSSLAAMAAISLEVFEKAHEIFGHDIGFRQIGYVVGVGEENADNLRKSLAAQREVGVQTEEIDKSEVAKLWPCADLGPFGAFGWEARGGYGDAYQTAQAMMVAARAVGIRLRQGATAARLLLAGDGVSGVALADGTEIHADVVVVAAGAWTSPFLAQYGITVPIAVHRAQIVLVAPGIALEAAPVFSDLVSLQYIRPEPDGDILFGNSDHAELDIADPDRYLNRADEAFLDLAVTKIGTRFPGLGAASVSGSYAGCYDVTPDWNPVISLCDIDGLIIAAGFSGHGFKIAPAVGRLVSDLIIDGRANDPRTPETDFRLSRFAENKPLKTRFPYVGAGEMR